MPQTEAPFFLWKHLNKLRWVSLITVFAMLILLPFLHVYQTFVSAHAYDLLAPSEKQLYDVMETLSSPFVSDPQNDLDSLKGTTWSGNLFGLKLSDPLTVLGQMASGLTLYWPFIVTALIPILATVVFGRFFCGWICPATFLYELNSKVAGWLAFAGYHTGNRRFDKRLKYGVLAVGVILSALTGAALFATIYPPAIIGREIYYSIAVGGFELVSSFSRQRWLLIYWSQGVGFAVISARAGHFIRCLDAIAPCASSVSLKAVMIAPNAMWSASSALTLCGIILARNAIIARPASPFALPTR